MEKKKQALKMIMVKVTDLCPLPWKILFLLSKAIEKKWTKPYVGFWEQNKKTYFMVNAGYYHVGIRIFK